MYLRFNPFLSYKHKRIGRVPYNEDSSLTIEELSAHLHKLDTSNISDKLRKETLSVLSRAHPDDIGVLSQIVTKELNLGIGSQINKALGWALIPEFKVPLASPYSAIDATNGYMIDVKYDGVRIISIVQEGIVTQYTRQGRKVNFPKIATEVLRLSGGADVTFDGEFITEKRTEVSGIVNRNMKSGYAENSELPISYVVFDMLPTAIFLTQTTSNVQSVRTSQLQRLFATVKQLRYCRVAETRTVYSERAAMDININNIAAGEEGSILKDPNAPYAFKRTKAWQKLKVVESTTLRVVGVTEGRGDRRGQIGALMCESEDKKLVVKVASGLTHELVAAFTENPPIGKLVEVLYNEVIDSELKDTKSLFLPRFVNIRIDVDEADTLEKIMTQGVVDARR